MNNIILMGSTSIPTPIPSSEKPKFAYKVVMVGPASVGKTTMLQALTSPDNIRKAELTVGASFTLYKRELPSCHVNLNLWDTAGQERYLSMVPLYIRDADVIILSYDVEVRSQTQPSLDQLRDIWIPEIKKYSTTYSPDALIFVACNKIDINMHSDLIKKGYELALQHGYIFTKTSSYKGIGVCEMFEMVIQIMAGRRQIPIREIRSGNTGMMEKSDIPDKEKTIKLGEKPIVMESTCLPRCEK